MDSKSTHGWFVRVYRGGQTHSKLFSDRPHGGKDAAFQAALQYKADYERNHLPELAALRFRRTPQLNNKSGVTGISETYHRDRKGKAMSCFCVSWNPEPNVRRSRHIYHHQYDNRDAAFQAAIEFRKAREAEILQSARDAKYPG